jgi:hypothetical protein
MDIAKKRKVATQLLLDKIDLLDRFTDSDNVGYWKKRLTSLSDSQFHAFMKSVRDKESCIYIMLPNMEKHPSMNDILKVAKKLGVKVFERIMIYDDITDTEFLTPHSHLVARIPIRRMQQYADHKMAVPEHDNKTDMLTGQVVHESRSAGITNPEIQSLVAKDLNDTNQEIVTYRGGNIEAWQGGFRKQAEETGAIRLEDIPKDSKNRTVMVAQILMEGLHLENNIAGE